MAPFTIHIISVSFDHNMKIVLTVCIYYELNFNHKTTYLLLQHFYKKTGEKPLLAYVGGSCYIIQRSPWQEALLSSDAG